MDIEDKILKALSRYLVVERFGWEEEDGLSGFVVSPGFQDMSSLDRQRLIDKALNEGSDALTPEERRRVLLIATLTPVEYEFVGSRIRIHRIREMAGGAIEVLLDGGLSDAEHVRGVFNNHKGIRTTKPKQVPRAVGVLMSFRAKGTETAPLTKSKAIRVLKNDPYIEVMANS